MPKRTLKSAALKIKWKTIELFVKYPKPGFKARSFVKKKVSGKKSRTVNIPKSKLSMKLFFASKWCLKKFGPHFWSHWNFALTFCENGGWRGRFYNEIHCPSWTLKGYGFIWRFFFSFLNFIYFKIELLQVLTIYISHMVCFTSYHPICIRACFS
jgi:hypothetical protein